jgi:hypothetical protein
VTDALHWIVVSSVFVSVFCKARHMDEWTPRRVKFQHGAALLLALLSLPVFFPPAWAPALLGGALWLHLQLETRRTPRGQNCHTGIC